MAFLKWMCLSLKLSISMYVSLLLDFFLTTFIVVLFTRCSYSQEASPVDKQRLICVAL